MKDLADPPIDQPIDRLALQRRTLRVLVSGQLVGAAALASAVTVGAFVVQDMLGQQTPWSGLSTAGTTIGTAFMSQVLARVMRRGGRRPGLQLGYGLAVIGGLIAAFGVEHRWLGVFLVGLFLYGNGQAANLISRYAATDLAAPSERGRAMSRVVFASTFGAVLGPVLIGPAESAGEQWFGLAKYTGPWLFSSLFFAASLINVACRLRPDPLVLSGGTSSLARGTARTGIGPSLRLIRASAEARLALLAMLVTQAVMVAVMAMTSVHLKLHGHEGASQVVVSTHIAGMFALSPFVGRYTDRRGPLAAILTGSIVLVAANTMAALSGDIVALFFPSLWLLGMGWTFGLIGGSNLLIATVPLDRRVAVQGSADLLMSLCGGVAGFASGFVRRAIGFHLLATAAVVATGLLVVAAYTTKRNLEADSSGASAAPVLLHPDPRVG